MEDNHVVYGFDDEIWLKIPRTPVLIVVIIISTIPYIFFASKQLLVLGTMVGYVLSELEKSQYQLFVAIIFGVILGLFCGYTTFDSVEDPILIYKSQEASPYYFLGVAVILLPLIFVGWWMIALVVEAGLLVMGGLVIGITTISVIFIVLAVNWLFSLVIPNFELLWVHGLIIVIVIIFGIVVTAYRTDKELGKNILLDYSPVGALLVHMNILLIGVGKTIVGVNIESYEKLIKMKGHSSKISNLTVVDNKLYSYSHADELAIWDISGEVENWHYISRFKNENDPLHFHTISHDGSRLNGQNYADLPIEEKLAISRQILQDNPNRIRGHRYGGNCPYKTAIVYSYHPISQ